MGVNSQASKALALHLHEFLIINIFVTRPLKAVLNCSLWILGYMDTMNTMELDLNS